jgi:hypothetical protein
MLSSNTWPLAETLGHSTYHGGFQSSLWWFDVDLFHFFWILKGIGVSWTFKLPYRQWPKQRFCAKVKNGQCNRRYPDSSQGDDVFYLSCNDTSYKFSEFKILKSHQNSKQWPELAISIDEKPRWLRNPSFYRTWHVQKIVELMTWKVFYQIP